MRVTLMSKHMEVVDELDVPKAEDVGVIKCYNRYYIFLQLGHDAHGNKTVPIFVEAVYFNADAETMKRRRY